MESKIFKQNTEKHLQSPAKRQKTEEQPETSQLAAFCQNRNEDVSISDVITIYENVPKLRAVELYLNLIYRPFTLQVNTKCRYKLGELDWYLSNTSYEPNKHSALFVQTKRPMCSLKVYSNGSIYCQGYNYRSAALGIHRLVDSIEELGYSPVYHNPCFNVVNATFAMPFAIDLLGFYESHIKDCHFDPQKRPYLIYEMRNSIIKLAIFPQGFVYVLLALSPGLTRDAISHILPLLYRHVILDVVKDNEGKTEFSCGDINFKLLWEKEFQNEFQHMAGKQWKNK